ncbi:hypothetical protein [Streptomyces sp. NPDC002205]|uniref:hypothetical protein n=1 Tax=Streptomyces sp. NPDC002205 TaxID=3154411 RepID=UPI0033218817
MSKLRAPSPPLSKTADLEQQHPAHGRPDRDDRLVVLDRDVHRHLRAHAIPKPPHSGDHRACGPDTHAEVRAQHTRHADLFSYLLIAKEFVSELLATGRADAKERLVTHQSDLWEA